MHIYIKLFLLPVPAAQFIPFHLVILFHQLTSFCNFMCRWTIELIMCRKTAFSCIFRQGSIITILIIIILFSRSSTCSREGSSPSDCQNWTHHETSVSCGGRSTTPHHVDQRRKKHPQRLDALQSPSASSPYQRGGGRGCWDIYL